MEKLKSLTKKSYSMLPNRFKRKNIIIVSSYGRSGSTMLWQAISESIMPGRVFGKRICSAIEGGIWAKNPSVKSIDKGRVLKTHFRPDDLSYEVPLQYIKNIYIISKPSDSVKSIIQTTEINGLNWFHKHMANLGVPNIKAPEQLVETDALDLEGRIFDWLQTPIDSITVKFEELWDHKPEISAWLGCELILPNRRDRAEKRGAVLEKVDKTYSVADEKYAQFDTKIVNLRA